MSRAVIGAQVPPMFEIGESYWINWLDGGEDTSSTFEVVSWEAPLLKVRQGDQITIFNTSSTVFLKARPRVGAGYNLNNL